MELYRRVVACEALTPQTIKYIRIGHREFMADDVLKALQLIGFKKITDCREVDMGLADCLVREGILLKSLGGRPCYKPVQGRFMAFYQEFLEDYWEDECMLVEDNPPEEEDFYVLDDSLDDWLDSCLEDWEPISCLKLLPAGSQKKPKIIHHPNKHA